MILKIEGADIEVLLIQVEVLAVRAVVHQALVPLLHQVVQHPHPHQDRGQDHCRTVYHQNQQCLQENHPPLLLFTIGDCPTLQILVTTIFPTEMETQIS